MKAIMSELLKNILVNPKRAKKLRINLLKFKNSKAKVIINNKTYEIEII